MTGAQMDYDFHSNGLLGCAWLRRWENDVLVICQAQKNWMCRILQKQLPYVHELTQEALYVELEQISSHLAEFAWSPSCWNPGQHAS